MADLSPFAETIFQRSYAFHPEETWEECAARVAKTVTNDPRQEQRFFELIRDRIFIPGGRYLYTAGRPKFSNSNCYGFIAEDSREGWGQILNDAVICLSMGGGLGINYSALRCSGSPIRGMGGTASGPLALAEMTNEVARHVMAGGKRRSALWGGLNWDHPDIGAWISVKDWDDDTRWMKSRKFDAHAPLDMTNISVIIGDRYLEEVKRPDSLASALHRDICERMLRTGEPGFLNLSLRLRDDPLAVTTNACVPGTVKFLTPSLEWIQLSKLTEYDIIWTGYRWAPITKIWSTGVKTVWQLHFSGGQVLECTGDHNLIHNEQRIPAYLIGRVDTSEGGPGSSLKSEQILEVYVIGDMEVYDFTVDAPEHTALVNGVLISNCTEATLHHMDTCNLNSVVMPRIRDLDHLEYVVRNAIQFLYNGSVRATYPTEKIASVARRNRRLGMGIMGLHEFMLLNGRRYEWFPKLERFMQVWKEVSDDEAKKYADLMAQNRPVARRAIAPTGTISIIAETTSGLEPIFCRAYKRRYINGGKYYFQYVVDPTARRLMEMGIPAKNIEDAYTLSYDVERRLFVNSKVQEYTDQAISSTINLPEYSAKNPVVSVDEFASLMQRYLPKLKGITTYPNNSRPGQPLVPVSIEEALGQEGVVFEENEDRCSNGVCGL